MARIGFIGLGDMGQVIVPRLLEAGHQVTGWNRSPRKEGELVAAGMAVATTPAARGGGAEVVFSIVTDAAAVRSVALGETASSPAWGGRLYLDMSTIAPDASRAISAEFAAGRFTMLDAPISGSPVTLAQGNASVMVGGDQAASSGYEPVLRAIGPKVTTSAAAALRCR